MEQNKPNKSKKTVRVKGENPPQNGSYSPMSSEVNDFSKAEDENREDGPKVKYEEGAELGEDRYRVETEEEMHQRNQYDRERKEKEQKLVKSKDEGNLMPVSYTHLTLPTIYSV